LLSELSGRDENRVTTTNEKRERQICSFQISSQIRYARCSPDQLTLLEVQRDMLTDSDQRNLATPLRSRMKIRVKEPDTQIRANCAHKGGGDKTKAFPFR
jgi:hypothetical protein